MEDPLKIAHFVLIRKQTWPPQSILKIFLNRPIRNKNCLWRPCLLMDRDKMCNPYREPSIDASYEVTVHLLKPLNQMK
jgi:hypothetical protein